MSNIETLVSLLRLLSASGGEVETRIRIQKEAYLLATANLCNFRVSDFYYHHYGPYSRGLSDTLQYAVSSDLIEEAHESFDESFTKYTYRLTSRGKKLAQATDKDDNRPLTKVVDFLKSKSWRALELAATVRFLELNEGFMDRSAAFEQAMALKPATVSYRDEAHGILNQIG